MLMRKESLWIIIATVLAVTTSFLSFTLALAYLQIPKEIPVPEEIEEIEVSTIELKEPPKTQEIREIKKEKAKTEPLKKEEPVKKVILPYYARLLQQKRWEGTGTSKIVIILDDAGYNVNSGTQHFFQLQIPLTFSVIPGLKYSKEIANIAYEKGNEIMIHMPMEYCGNSKMTNKDKLSEKDHNMKPYKYAVFKNMSKEQIEKNIEEAINDIPHAVGLNNHMGSDATADEVVMSYVLDKIKSKNFYFIDSVTTAHSVAYNLAKNKGIRANKRHVFLDNENDVDYIKERINELIYQAKRRGYAIGIGHATKPVTAQALLEMMPKFKEYNIEVVPASQLVY